MKVQSPAMNREIVRLTLPAIISNITVPLLGLSDTAIAGHLGDQRYLAIIGVGASMLSLSFWLFGFLRMGTTGLTAGAYGSGSRKGVGRVLGKAVRWSLLIGILLLLFRIPLGKILTSLILPSGELGEEALEYYSICMYAAPAQLTTMALMGWMVGMQSTFWPMVVSIVTNLLNIPLSLLFVSGFGVGFPGLAFGTSIAQWCGCLLAIWAARHLWKKTFTSRGEAESDDGPVGKLNFLSVNVNLFFRSACVMGVMVGMTAFGGRLGELPLAANALLMQFFHFFSFFMDGFAYSAEALTGRFVGGKRWEELRISVRYLLFWSGGIALVFTLLYLFGGGIIAGLLTDSESVLEYLKDYRWTMALIPLLSVGAFIFDGFYIGMTRTGMMLVAAILSGGLFYSVMLLSYPHFGNQLLWSAFFCYLFGRGLFLGLLYPKNRRELERGV